MLFILLFIIKLGVCSGIHEARGDRREPTMEIWIKRSVNTEWSKYNAIKGYLEDGFYCMLMQRGDGEKFVKKIPESTIWEIEEEVITEN